MSYWNPLNKAVLYLHVTYRNNDDYYLKIDVVRQRVFKLCYKQAKHIGKYFKVGVYEVKWSTFTTGYIWHMKPCNIASKKKYEAVDGLMRCRIKHTTQKQWKDHLKILIKEIL